MKIEYFKVSVLFHKSAIWNGLIASVTSELNEFMIPDFKSQISYGSLVNSYSCIYTVGPSNTIIVSWPGLRGFSEILGLDKHMSTVLTTRCADENTKNTNSSNFKDLKNFRKQFKSLARFQLRPLSEIHT